MPLTSRIAHNRMMTALPLIFSSLCTIGHEVIAQDPNSGQEIITYPADPLLTNIKCYVDPLSGRGTGEMRRTDQTIVSKPFTIALQGYYPTIDEEDQVIVDSSIAYNILFVRHDDTHTITFLDVEKVT